MAAETFGDPFKDTSSVAMHPVIMYSQPIGILALEIGIYIAGGTEGSTLTMLMAVLFLIAGMTFVWRSFYGMRIEQQ